MQHAYRHTYLFCLAAAALCLSGCTSFSDYVHHGFKVGPEYTGAKAAVAPGWIDATDIRVRSHAADLSRWWCVFNDPVLNDLVYHAYNQNINLKEYGTRILQARYQLAIAKGEIFPQTQAGHRQLYPQSGIDRLEQRHPRHSQVHRQVESRLQPGLGIGLLGAVPPSSAGRQGPIGGLGGELRRRAGHLAGRRIAVLRPDARSTRKRSN